VRWLGVTALVVILVSYVALEAAHRTDALLVDYDPSMPYLLESLNLLRGQPYTYVDHPGTPVEILGSLFLLGQLVASGGSVDRLVADTLARPERFLLVAEVFLLGSSVVVVVALARWSVPGTSRPAAVAALIAAALYFAAHAMAPLSLTWWSHNSFALIGETLLGLLVLNTVRASRPPTLRRALGLGLLCGLLAAVQAYFVAATLGTAMAVAIALHMRGARSLSVMVRSALVVEAAGLGFLIATALTAGYVLNFFSFLLSIAQHQGRYGQGPEGFMSPDLLAASFSDLIRHAPLLFLLLLIASAGLVIRLVLNWQMRREHVALYAAGPAFLIQTAVLVFAIAKHPSQVYLLSVAAMLPLLVAVWLEAESFRSCWSRRALYATAALVGVLAVGNLLASVLSREAEYASNRAANTAVEGALAQIAAQRGVPASSLSVVWGYGTANRCYTLWFGVPRLGTLASEILRACPSNGELNVFTAETRPARWDVAVIPEQLRSANDKLQQLGSDEDLGVPSLGYGNLHMLINPQP
jgi:hypothetical protein